MSRKPKIRWREVDQERLLKQVERFNAKVYRNRAKHPERRDILPDTIKKSDVDRMIKELQSQSRSEFNKLFNSLERFTRKGAEKEVVSKTGFATTKWEKNEVALKVAQINRERTRERKLAENFEATTRGEKIGLKRGEMGSERLNELKPKTFNFDKIRSGYEWEKFKLGVDKMVSPQAKDKRMEEYKANYIKGLENAFGEHARDLINLIKELPADVVVKTYYSEQEATIDFFYELQEMDTKLDILGDVWQGVADEYEEVHR